MECKVLSRCDADEAVSIVNSALFEIKEADFNADSYISQTKKELSKEGSILSHSIGVERSHEFTAELAQLDRIFDDRVICFKSFVSANTHSSDDAIAQNAEKIWKKMAAYDLNLYKLGYEKELARAFSMIEEFETPELKVTIDLLLGVTTCLSEVKTAAINLQALYRKNQGVLATKEDSIPSSTQTKVLIDILNDKLLPYLSVMAKVKPAKYEDTFVKIAQYIETVNTKIRTRRTRTTATEEASIGVE